MPARFPVKKSGRHGPGAPLSGAAPTGAANAAAAAGSRARVIAAHGHMLTVRLEHGGEAVARAMGRKLQVVCGDYVRCEFDERHGELRIVALEPRSGALYRSNAHGSGELIAANLSLLLVVVAPLPAPDFYIVDRYLAAAQCAALKMSEAARAPTSCALPSRPRVRRRDNFRSSSESGRGPVR